MSRRKATFRSKEILGGMGFKLATRILDCQ